jgi:lipopolysaccharide export system permease protein
MLVLAVPIGILFGTLMAFGSMASNHEVTIFKTGGMNLLKMMMPVIIIGILATAIMFWFNDRILPMTNHKAKILLSDVTRKKPTFSIDAGQFSTDIEGYTILSRSLDSASGVLKGVTIYDNSRGQRINIATADSGRIDFAPDYSKMIIRLRHGEIHQLTQGSEKDYRKILFDSYQFIIGASGFSFERTGDGMISKGDRELTIAEMQKVVNDARKSINSSEKRLNKAFFSLWKFINGDSTSSVTLNQANSNQTTKSWTQALREADKRMSFNKASIISDINQINDFELRAEQFEVEIYKKYSIPFACILFVLVGCPLGIISRRGNFGTSAGISLAFYLFYWISLIGGEKLADRGFFSPFLSMWMGNIIIGIVGIIVLIRVSNENFSFKNTYLFRRFRK